MNGEERLDRCGEFPVARALLGVGVGVELPRGVRFFVVEYAPPAIGDARLARRMKSLCAFEGPRARAA